MRSVSLRLVDLERNPLIPLGFEGENEYTTVRVDCKKIFDEHPDAVATLAVTPPEGDSYPAVIVRDGDIVSWTVTDSDLVHSGTGEIQFAFVIDDTIIGKTYKARTRVLDSIVPSGEAPTPIQNWLIQAAAALQALPTDVANSVAALMGAMVGVGETLDPDDDVTVNYDPVNNTLTIGVPHGRDGEDGHTPAITANKVGKVATFYVDGVSVAQISDGQDADPTALIDDTSTAQNRTWSAKKLDEEKSSLKTEMNSRPSVMHDDSESSLDITDEEGYVVARFKDGHFSTKKFDSSYAPAIMGTTKAGIPLDIVDENGYVILRLSDGHIKTKNFDSVSASVGFEYKFSGDDLLIAYGYNSTDDAVVVMNCGRANGLFDFAGLKTKPKGTSLQNLETADLTTVWSSGTDMHGPFQFLANQNADGYHADATSAGFVGGNHTLDQMGSNFKTAESVYVEYFADGASVSSGYGRATKFEVRWANDVQAYNTVKQGGGGRACLREEHDMIFDGVRFSERITLIPLEEITMSLWYGFQCVAIGSVYTNIAFVDATNRQIFASSDSDIQSGNSVTSGFIGYGDEHRIEMNVDTGVDLGKRSYYSGIRGAFVSSTKGYFFIIGQNVTMSGDTTYYLDGSFRFMPSIIVE